MVGLVSWPNLEDEESLLIPLELNPFFGEKLLEIRVGKILQRAEVAGLVSLRASLAYLSFIDVTQLPFLVFFVFFFQVSAVMSSSM